MAKRDLEYTTTVANYAEEIVIIILFQAIDLVLGEEVQVSDSTVEEGRED